MTYFIAVANGKGGVAKTTTTISLSGAFAKEGKRVLAIDLDPQGNLSLGLGIPPADAKKSAADLLLNNKNPKDAILPSKTIGIDVIPSNSGLRLVEQNLPGRASYAVTLRNAFRNHNTLPYDFILFDCPPAIGPLTINAISAANLLIIPTQPEYYSAHALKDMLGLISKIRKHTNPGLIYRVLVTMLDRRNRIHRTVLAQVRKTFDTGAFQSVIEIDTQIRESAIAGQPISHYKPSTRSASQYRALAEELTIHAKEKNIYQA